MNSTNIDSVISAFSTEQPSDSGLLNILANARWQSGLITALIPVSKNINDTNFINNFNKLSEMLMDKLALDKTNFSHKNAIKLAIEPLAINEIKQDGTLLGEWLDSLAHYLMHNNDFLKPLNSSHFGDSAHLTRATHLSELFSQACEFSFLRDTARIVTWSDKIITQATDKSVALLSGTIDPTLAMFQNQLNAHRKIFLACYATEVRQWKPLIDQTPDIVSLYPDGMPISGIDLRFKEHCKSFSNLMLNESDDKVQQNHYANQR